MKKRWFALLVLALTMVFFHAPEAKADTYGYWEYYTNSASDFDGKYADDLSSLKDSDDDNGIGDY